MADENRTTDHAKIEADRKANAEKTLSEQRKEIDERVAQAYEHEDPTPTQAENDAAKLAATNQEPEPPPPPPEGGVTQQPAGSQSQRRSVEANKPGSGYDTRSTEHKKPE